MLLVVLVGCGAAWGNASRFAMPTPLVDVECVAAGGEHEPVQSEVFTEQSCEDIRLFRHAGDAVATSEKLMAFVAENVEALTSAPGVRGLSVENEGCDHLAEDGAHLRIRMTACVRPTASIIGLIETLVAQAPIRHRAFFVELDIGELPGPRCQQDDPSCQALAYYDESALSEAPLAERTPVHRSEPEMGRFSGGTCTYDGECVRAGCGNHCVSWTVPGFMAICPMYEPLEQAFCGCVSGACTWFTD